jgi:hypothetical protein
LTIPPANKWGQLLARWTARAANPRPNQAGVNIEKGVTMKTKEENFKCEPPILDLEDLLKDKSLRVIGVVGDKNQGKSGLLYNIISIIRRLAPDTQVVTFRMLVKIPGVLSLNTLLELSKIRNSFIIIDELKTIVDTDNRKETQTFLEILQTLYHANNTIVVCGLAHNFNGKISGELEAIIFKQTTLISVIKRSNLDYLLRPLTHEGKASKNEYCLSMPVDGALIYHPHKAKSWHYVTVPYMPEFDTKKDNEPVIKWKH